MNDLTRLWLALGAANAFLSVAMGAFAAHALRPRLEPRMVEVFETAARYQMFHALGMLAVAWVVSLRPAASFAGWAMLGGVVLFSGSLYAMALTGVRALGAITPFGGVCFLVGWALLARAALLQ